MNMNQNTNVNNSPLLTNDSVSRDEYERTLQIRIEKNKERYQSFTIRTISQTILTGFQDFDVESTSRTEENVKSV